jgi:ABC-type lipoprotein export system ATPase subunit
VHIAAHQQRVERDERNAVNNPKLILADEPTGNVDSKASAEILNLLRQLNREWEITLLLVTHDVGFAAQADRVLHLRDGGLLETEN